MAQIIITLKVMPVSTETDLKDLQEKINETIKNFYGDFAKVEIEPIAFGLKAMKFIFLLDESKGSTEGLEKEISSMEGVNSVEVVDVRRTIG